MLQSLQIKNLALVDTLNVEFESGLNVITGETGAGKSMIVGALNLLLGERADKTLLRTGADQCVVEAVFQMARPDELHALLQASGIECGAEDRLIVKRAFTASGAGRQFVNNSPVTLQVLKRIGELLVDMHGPHDHQSLLSADFQLNVLDAFGRLEKELAAYRAEYDCQQALLARRQALTIGEADIARQVDLLAFQVRELEAAALREEEEAEIIREQNVLGNAQAILQWAEEIRQVLTEAEESAFNRLAAAQQALDKLAALVPSAAGWKSEARTLAEQIQDLSAGVGALARNIEGDPGRLQWLDDRLAVYQKLKRKYGASVADLLKLLDQTRERLRDLQTRDEQVRKLDAELNAGRQRLEALGQALRRKREPAAKQLVKAITAELQDLGFEKAAFAIAFSPGEPRADGMDTLDFTFAPNPGEPQRPLRAIASSGEMSRVMLAVKTVLAEHDRIPVLIFDEIDVNIGGKTARRVGEKLAEVARRRQVLCITHLPQVAVHGNVQFAVEKRVQNGRTVAHIIKLDSPSRIEEIARMLGGRDTTRVTLDHARELLEKASANIVLKAVEARPQRKESGS
ncbi:MAG: DNA repair protein RecN [Verrucomicrobia bacterium]|nr:DNA repair protein RecN [Verrucomicrobiota bacterium]MBU1733784.1 DNA repair protein RecN [Verrucomicrobiota bacterium]MBU1856733.1 DNA repair protein RecN [Verrucomicrobiota bacterium]